MRSSRHLSHAKRLAPLAIANPGLLAEKLCRRVIHRSRPAGDVAEGRIGTVSFSFDLTLDARVEAMYARRYEVSIVRLLRKHLSSGSVFVDVGANIGYLSAVAADIVGPDGRVIAFEPVAAYYGRLCRLRDDNPSHDIKVFRKAVGASHGTTTVRVSNAGNIGYNSLLPEWIRDEDLSHTEVVEVSPLDHLLDADGVRRLDVLKIDTEGYEFPILEGASKTLERLRPVVIVEVTESAVANHGRTLTELADLITSMGYSPRSVEMPRRGLDVETIRGRVDVLLLPV